MLEQYLDDLEARLEPKVEDDIEAQWGEFCQGRFQGDIFSPVRPEPTPPKLDWPAVLINDALEDFELMALRELAAASLTLKSGSGRLLMVRANYGTGILSSIFGADIFYMEPVQNTLPTSIPLPGGADTVRRLLDTGMPELRTGFGAKVLDMGRYYQKIMTPYPKISRYVHVYHPDLQGPMDICELLWGSELFLELLDKPELVKKFLCLITDTYISFMHEWQKLFPPCGDTSMHWGHMHRGQVMLRDDSAMNLSPEMFEEFIEPYDSRILQEFGGGGIHFCGRGDHYIHRLPGMPMVSALAMSQPEYNNMETIFQHTVDRGIQLLGLRRSTAEEALRAGRDLHGNVNC